MGNSWLFIECNTWVEALHSRDRWAGSAESQSGTTNVTSKVHFGVDDVTLFQDDLSLTAFMDQEFRLVNSAGSSCIMLLELKALGTLMQRHLGHYSSSLASLIFILSMGWLHLEILAFL